MSQLGIGGRGGHGICGRVGAGVVADEMEVLPGGGEDAEGLLDETVGFVSVPLLALHRVCRRAVARHCRSNCRGVEAAATPLALHFAVGEKAARNSASAPRLAVGPSAHSGLPLVPDEDGSGSYLLPLFLRQSALHSGQGAQPASFEEDDGIVRRLDVAVVCFHVISGVRIHVLARLTL